VTLWLVAAAALTALVVALVAVREARAARRRQEQLTQMYWELKYQQGELRQRLPQGPRDVAEEPPTRPTGTVIPLSSLKR
jgi:hypothetical protein